jgi:hypothetical protein
MKIVDQATRWLKGLRLQEKEITPCTKKDAALRKADLALNTWAHTYAPECCDGVRFAEARRRIDGVGTLAFIAEARQLIREALNTPDGLENEEKV